MWLINVETFQLEYFMESKIPKYAILSHTWEDEEVTFQEFGQDSAKSKKGYRKIERTCEEARKHGLCYAWVDTCCIDKSSSAELTESINSMYAWYQRAELCYVFLSDLGHPQPTENGLAACRWFERGWTLQELIAPSEVRFYNEHWHFIGTKTTLADIIASITGIEVTVLLEEENLQGHSVGERMRWAARRETTRTEDLAYCLLGIFDVNMPLIYGEGSKSFLRLQEEIIKRNNDITIFAWDREGEETTENILYTTPWPLLAPSPSGFSGFNGIEVVVDQRIPEFSMTNKGLRFRHFKQLYEWRIQGVGNQPMVTYYVLYLGYDYENEYAIPLRKTGQNVFCRDGKMFKDWDNSFPKKTRNLPLLSEFYIQVDAPISRNFSFSGLRFPFSFPTNEKVYIKEVIPEISWSATDQKFFQRHEYMYTSGTILFAAFCEINIGSNLPVEICVCIINGNEPSPKPKCVIFDPMQHKEHHAWVIQHRRAGCQLEWEGFEVSTPEIKLFTNKLEHTSQGREFTITGTVSNHGTRRSAFVIFDINKKPSAENQENTTSNIIEQMQPEGSLDAPPEGSTSPHKN